MLPKDRRIDRRLFNDVFARGVFFDGKYVSGKITPLASDTPTKFACVVPKKVFAKAVDRNRLRRQLYRAIASLLDRVGPGSAIILIAKSGLIKVESKILPDMLTSLLKHHHLYHD